jgi:predicted esterase
VHEHRIAVSRFARYFTIGRPQREVWFVLHGYGQLAARFLRHFTPLDDGTRLVVAPEGLSRFYLTEDPAERRVGASWMTKEDRQAEIENYVPYLDAVFEECVRSLDRAQVKVTLLGFSQGSATACRWFTMGKSRIDRLVVWGGEVPPDVELPRSVRLSLVYGSRDEYFTPKIITATEARLRAHDVPYKLVPFDGGHEVDAEVLKRVALTADS